MDQSVNNFRSYVWLPLKSEEDAIFDRVRPWILKCGVLPVKPRGMSKWIVQEKEWTKFHRKRSILRKIYILDFRARLQVFGVVGIQSSCSWTQKKKDSFGFKREADRKFSQKTNKVVSSDNHDFSRTRWLVTDLQLVGKQKDSSKKQRKKTRVSKIGFFSQT